MSDSLLRAERNFS